MKREYGVNEMKEFRIPKTLALQGIQPHGGGALSSDYVSKLGNKEVSKRLRNFSLAPKKACHCEDERSEDVAIAKSLNINEITTQSSIARNDNTRHPELVSGSITHPSLPLKREGTIRHAELVSASHNEMVFSRFTSHFSRKRVAFTLAEVLITLGIIGVVASLTLPSVVAHYKEKVLVTQVQKAYSEMQNALKMYSAQNNCSDITCISDTNQTSAQLADKLFVQFQGAQRCPGNWDTTRKTCKSVKIKNKTPYYQNGVASNPDVLAPYFISANGVAYQVLQHRKCPEEYERILRDDAGFPVLDEDGKPKTCKDLIVNCALIYFDANGVNKGPNQYGADIYRFNLTYDGKFVSYGDMINPALTKGKLEYTPYKLGQPKKE